jgi:hypothetical protein
MTSHILCKNMENKIHVPNHQPVNIVKKDMASWGNKKNIWKLIAGNIIYKWWMFHCQLGLRSQPPVSTSWLGLGVMT